MNTQPKHRHPGSLTTLLVAVLVAACGATTGSAGVVPTPPLEPDPSVATGSPDPTPGVTPSATPSDVATDSPSVTAGPTPTATTTGTTIVRAYFFLEDPAGGDPKLVAVLREVPKTKAVATAAMNGLLAGPTQKEATAGPDVTTAIPAGVKLLGLKVEDRVATVDLSKEFESGGGTASVVGRLAQVVYTLTQFSNVESVRFLLDGEPVEVFGSQGIVLDGPVGREQYHDQLPAIFVDRPAWGAAIGNPGRVAGLSNVFEATFRMSLFDGGGKRLLDKMQMADCGSGCWGSFDTTLGYQVAKAQWGTLRVYNPSAKDGTPEDIRDYPVWLTPAG
jgi:spore germination protein GerM